MEKNKISGFLIVLFLFSSFLHAQQYTPDRYFVKFTDKDNSQFNVSKPGGFLSDRAIERREQMNISIDTIDIPVNRRYLDSIRDSGASIHNTTKWLNGAVISVDTAVLLPDILQMSFVKDIDTVRYEVSDTLPVQKSKKFDFRKKEINNHKLLSGGSQRIDHGYSLNQISMLGVDKLHNAGYTGEGIMIAVLDVGFAHVDQMYSLRHLFERQNIIATRDFVDGGKDVFQTGFHGQYVLSIMAAYSPGVYVGTAPDATYALLCSEDVSSEFPVEELYWTAAAEYADSLGADVINSSLGYTDYDYPPLSYTYQDMDGNSTYVTRAADIASEKGMLVVNSAGNAGNGNWFYLGAPADGDSVLAVGAVNQEAEYASFSSKGPSYDGDVKPNVAAVGEGTFFLYYDNAASAERVSAGNGTSFSSPLIAGSCTSLWQAYRDVSNMELKQAVERSSSQYMNPDSLLGYGIPDFQFAGIILKKQEIVEKGRSIVHVMPNPFESSFYVVSGRMISADARFSLYDLNGKRIRRIKPQSHEKGKLFRFTGLNDLQQGFYILKIKDTGYTYSIKIFKGP